MTKSRNKKLNRRVAGPIVGLILVGWIAWIVWFKVFN